VKCRPFSITLVGPGGAGKSTVAALVAERLGIPVADLDCRFTDRAGDISAYINRFGYDAYARENVETYRGVLHEGEDPQVVALSSGFMTYAQTIHPEYARRRTGRFPQLVDSRSGLNRRLLSFLGEPAVPDWIDRASRK